MVTGAEAQEEYGRPSGPGAESRLDSIISQKNSKDMLKSISGKSLECDKILLAAQGSEGFAENTLDQWLLMNRAASLKSDDVTPS